MDLKQLATQLFMKNMHGANDSSVAESALNELIGKGDKFDLTDLVGKFTGKGGGLAEKAESWLGDGANDSVSASQLQDVLGQDKVEAFASKLGVSNDDASDRLADFLPKLIDKSSRGGSLLDAAGGLASMATKLFK